MFQNKYIIKGETTEIFLNVKNKDQKICLIDTEDLMRLIEYNKTWFQRYNRSNKKYYVYANIYLGTFNGECKSTTISIQTFLLGTRTGDKKNKIIIDHENHDTFDNRKYNLRIANNDDNSRNRSGKNSNNKSGYRNVFWNTKDERWMVTLQIDGKQKCFGRFKLEDIDNAGVWAEAMRQKHYGEYAGNS